MLGNRSKDAVGEFWEHCLQHDEWKDHPAFADPLVDKKSTILSEVCVKLGAENFGKHTLSGENTYLLYTYLELFWGIIPVTFHMDGAEFYRDAEYNVWSVSSILASGDDPLVE